MDNLQRVNLMIERQQRETLERLANEKGRSVSDLVREYITQGIERETNPQEERMQALRNARLLKQKIEKRRGAPVSGAVEIIQKMREERTNELLNSGR